MSKRVANKKGARAGARCGRIKYGWSHRQKKRDPLDLMLEMPQVTDTPRRRDRPKRGVFDKLKRWFGHQRGQ